MGRTEYYNNPGAPRPNSLVPASGILVVNEEGEILMQRRRDTGQWAIPMGKQEFGESSGECAVRETEEETGILAEITGLLGVYSNPHHIVEYSDGEIRQQYEVIYIGRPIGGAPRINDEADGVRWIAASDLGSYDIHPSIHEQISHFLSGSYPYLE